VYVVSFYVAIFEQDKGNIEEKKNCTNEQKQIKFRRNKDCDFKPNKKTETKTKQLYALLFVPVT
jgi:hypothetical protein